MSMSKEKFEELIIKFTKIDNVTRGKMKSDSSIEYKNETFTFLHGRNIVLNLGRSFDGTPYGIDTWYYPDYKIPSKENWVLIRDFYLEKWEILIMLALEKTKKD